MPVARFQLDDGRVARFEVPDGTTPEEAQSMMEEHFSQPENTTAPDKSSVRGEDKGAFRSGLQGFNATVPFGNRITAGAGAAGAYLLDSDARDMGISELYKQARADQKATESAHEGANIAGGLLGVAATLPIGLAKGAASTTPVIGNLANAAQKTSAAAGNFVRGGEAATRAGKIARGAALAIPSGAVYGYGASGSDLDSTDALKDAGVGAGVGFAGSVALPAAGAIASGVKNAVLPKVSQSIQPLAQKALDMGIPLTRSQVGDSRFAKVLSSTANKVPFSGGGDFAKKQQSAFNRAVAKTIGEDADVLTPDVVDAAYTNIGKKFDDALGGQTIKVNDEVLSRLGAIEEEAANSITGDHLNIVKRNLNKFLNDIAEDGTISGDKINSFRSALSKTLRGTNNDASPYLHVMLDTVIDASVDGSPARRELLDQARRQYRNLKTIEPLAAKAQNGDIAPSLLLGRVTSDAKGKMYHARGKSGELGDLARIGQTFLKEPIPNSGTQERLLGAAALGGGAVAEPVTAATMIAGSRGFNTLNQSQKLVKRAVASKGGSAGGKSLAPLTLPAQGAIINQNEMRGRELQNSLQRNGITPGVPDVQLPKANMTPETVTTVEPLSYNAVIPAEGSAVTPALVERFAKIESNGNPNARASTSSAKGLLQFTNAKWKEMVGKYGEQTGISMKDIFNPEAQKTMGALSALEHEQALSKSIGRQPNATDLYAAHFLGLGGAKKLLASLGTDVAASKLFPEAARANRNIFYDKKTMRPRTTDEVYQLLNNKVSA